MTNHEKTLRALDQPQLRAGEADLRVDDRGGSMLRACACSEPDPVMQVDRKFYCHRCSFQTGARPVGLEPELWMMPAGTLTQEMALNNGSTTPLLPDMAGAEPRLNVPTLGMYHAILLALSKPRVEANAWMLLETLAEQLEKGKWLLSDGWQSIETAPKDGTQILLAKAGTDWFVRGFWWTEDESSIGHWFMVGAKWEPTHWMPVPSPKLLTDPAPSTVEG